MSILPNKRTLLILLPFWTPMIPPMGIASLKKFLKNNGFGIKTLDANIEVKARGFYNNYFNVIKGTLPKEKWSNLYSIGHHVLRNHLMAYQNMKPNDQYMYLLEKITFSIFYYRFNKEQLFRLNEIIIDFYKWLRTYTQTIIEQHKPNVLGISVLRDTLPASLYVFKEAKKLNPSIKTIMGGAVFSEQLIMGSPDMEYFLKETTQFIDKIIIGQGENYFLKYLQNCLPGDKRIYSQHSIDYEKLDFNSTLLPDYSDFNIQKYPFIGATGSNGCEFDCSFCNVLEYFGKFYKKDINQLVNEMSLLYKKYKISTFYMTDHMINPIIKGLSQGVIDSNLPLYWTAYLRVSEACCEESNAKLWRQGGLYCARLGIESGSQNVLDLIGKKITIEQSKKTIKLLASMGVKTTTYWFVGHPGETEADFQMTLDLLEELKDDIYEAESDYFNYHYSGQADSLKWCNIRKPLFNEEERKYLMIQTWTLDCEPQREEIFSRLNRFVNHCEKLGIPNPYTLSEIISADKRWKKLHDNSVPALLDLKEEIIEDPFRQSKQQQNILTDPIIGELSEFEL